MSKIEIKVENDILTIHKNSSRIKPEDTENYQINLLEIGKEYKSNLRVTKAKDKNKILFMKELDTVIENDDLEELDDEDLENEKQKSQPVIVVYSQEENPTL